MATKSVKKTVISEEKKTAVKKVSAKKNNAPKISAAKKKTVKKSEINTAAATNIPVGQNVYNDAYIIVDHPCENETVYGNHYAIRIGASMHGYVEISFNDGEWHPCRFGGGYWWFDWMYYKSGACKISARLISDDGTIIKISDIRKCKVS